MYPVPELRKPNDTPAPSPSALDSQIEMETLFFLENTVSFLHNPLGSGILKFPISPLILSNLRHKPQSATEILPR
jgi:hypothetical protein